MVVSGILCFVAKQKTRLLAYQQVTMDAQMKELLFIALFGLEQIYRELLLSFMGLPSPACIILFQEFLPVIFKIRNEFDGGGGEGGDDRMAQVDFP